MIAILRIEAIGCDLPSGPTRGKVFARKGGDRVTKLSQYLHAGNPWVARVGAGGRHFLTPRRDYGEARQAPTGLRGVYLCYELLDGETYEVHELLDWDRSRRYFVRAEQGKVVEISKEAAKCQPSAR